MNDEITELAGLVGGIRYKFCSSYIPSDYEAVVDDLISGNTTYSRSGGTQCVSFKNRSVIDVIRTVWYYFPAVPLVDILQYIATNLKKREISAFYCQDVRKIVLSRAGFYGSLLDGYGMGNGKGAKLVEGLLKKLMSSS